ncbi:MULTISPECIES: TetR/AcrR family transcriptional regulator [Myxococcus]|uniref:TetR/AcrR family transcriptional regulator n=1 Tax=Myxococcus llanfairpwllgwyngyllgogerychwyrndrobwllllantysiliogogogochensis TaxID=2590453 RepID=A0A540WS45_9BACT|nr:MULTISPECIES: TetR/AcrR family transcriptional regulator [Myxococcus]NTX05657.1 TetR/AcrR family transcriptional regulator [Myxococcus sp. CA040A]NTX10283.1 TetR/AcrR family transcriptional regulator [Myxococcus sp. CA056]NTX54710.1 TetR/AcrR family transcriptional regulator [Myxococcus sp. CA039A]TQF11846.1 TetR/AcrR family transcriptional regulator [Myxococcus llanfairpwllgwyngyllgogerychwyrndrobwllllantysiliogogogochensis]
MNRPSTSPDRSGPVTPRGQRTRAKLLKAAESVFGEKGYERASIADITRKGGVALGTFYVYFPDKQSIFVEVVDDLGTRLRRLIGESTAACDSRMDVEREGLRTFFQFVRQHPNLYRVVRQAEFVDADCYRRYYDRFAKGYVNGLSIAMDAGEVRRMDPEALAYCLMGIADFLGMRWVLWEEDPGLERVLDTAMGLIRHGLDARSAAPARNSVKSTPSKASPAKAAPAKKKNTLRPARRPARSARS